MRSHQLLIAGEPLPIRFRRHATAKRVVLRLNRDGTEAVVTLPRRCSERKAMEFVKTQEGWLRGQLAKKTPRQLFTPGMELPLFGTPTRCEHHAKHSTEMRDGTLYIGGDKEFFPRRLKDYITRQARCQFGDIARELAAELGETLSGITIRDTRSRWGSCSSKKRINLSWRLALAPASVSRYVIAHEVAHLRHFDHSPAFWYCVETLHPNHQQDRNWLRKHGNKLHAYEV